MAQNCGGWCWSLGLVSSLAISGACAFSWDCTFAQITPDSTLPNSSSVKLEGNTRIIEGGTQAGSNLFHSFGEFSVPNGSTAFFNNALDIQNIISRVTGGSVSNINGLIKANGTANLFLINPNGIIFGPNAQLDIRGSFLASTASSLKFADGTEFSAKAPQNTPLLTVNVPIGLQFGGTAGGIRVQGSNLEVQPDRTLALVGGDVTLEGGERAASEKPNLASLGGRIELGSVAGVGEVSLNQRGNSWVFGYDRVNAFGNIRLEDKAFVNASGERGGNIQIQGDQLDMTQGSLIYADTEGTEAGGEVLVRTTKAITLNEGSQITADVLNTATGTGGEVTIKTGQLSIQGGAQVSTSTYNSGRGGNLSVTATDSVELRGTRTSDQKQISSSLFSRTYSAGDAGNLTIATRRLSVSDGAQVSASSYGEMSTGKAGNLTVDASYVELIGTTPNGEYPSGLLTQTQGVADAGNLTIMTQKLSVQKGAQVSASSSPSSRGKAGNLTVNASEVELSGKDGEYISGLFVLSQGSGSAGNLLVQARSIKLDNQGKISAKTEFGQGGDIKLDVADLLQLRRGSTISTSADGNGDGGNINIDTKFLVSVPSENSDITANAFSGKGGRITINATGIFGMVQRSRQDLERFNLDPSNLPTNDITAISQTNPSLNGTVKLNTPEIDPNSGLVNLPSVPVDTKLAQSCTVGSPLAKSQFTITGRGGLPSNPGEPLNTDAVQVDLITLNPSSDNRKSQTVTSKTTTTVPEPIIEATGWIINEKGEVVLIANSPTTPHSPWYKPASCKANQH